MKTRRADPLAALRDTGQLPRQRLSQICRAISDHALTAATKKATP